MIHEPASDRHRERAAEALEQTFRAQASAIFSGVAVASDGTVEIFVTKETPAVKAAIQASGVQPISIRVLSGRQNTLATLELIRDAIKAEASALTKRGLKLTQLGVDIYANKVLIGVELLDDATKEILERKYGADRVGIFESGGWRTTPLIEGPQRGE